MNKNSLSVLAIILIMLMAIVAVAGIDGLPRSLRTSVEAAATRVTTDRTQFEESRAAVSRAISSEPELFRTQAALWQTQFAQADARLKKAEADLAQLQELKKANRREDRDKVEAALKEMESLRSGSLQEAQKIRADADRWLGYKKNLPQQLASMRSNYEALRAFDVEAQSAATRKAITDWPAKKADLEQRVSALDALKTEGEQAWSSSAEARAKAETKDYGAVDYAALFAAGEAIERDLQSAQRGVSEMNTLAAQLYVDRDKLLLELDDDNGTKQKVRVVETKYADSALTGAATTSKEEWENVTPNRFDELKRSIGMVVERKPAGKFDSEADRTMQAPAYAYVAAPGQSNRYGAWDNGVWHWLPQYLILSQLLRSSNGPVISTGDYYSYDRARRSGQVWHGSSGEYGRTWSRSSGTSSSGGGTVSSGSTRPREGWSWGGSTFGGSKYQSKGTFGGSRYQSRPRGSGGSGFGFRGYSRGGSFGRGFGRGGRR
jgi:hypothetical protein